MDSLKEKISLRAHFKRTSNIQLDEIRFPDVFVQEIKLYSYSIETKKIKKDQQFIKKRIYHFELHIYDGFSFLKFYPKIHKSNPNKYKLRDNDLGFNLNFGQVRLILKFCALIIKTYLDENPNCFAGYIGQTDEKDNIIGKERIYSQRSTIYNQYTSSLFLPPKYSLSARELFGAFNLKLIRRIRIKHQEFTLNNEQLENFECFKSYLLYKENDIPMCMTRKTKSENYPNLF